MNAELEMLCNRLLGALVNGGYQGLLLTTVVWLGLKLVPRANATTRHAVWLVALLFVAALPVFHLLLPDRESRIASDRENSIGAGGRQILSSEKSAKILEVNPGLNRMEDRNSGTGFETVSRDSLSSDELAGSIPKDLARFSEKEAARENLHEAEPESSTLGEPLTLLVPGRPRTVHRGDFLPMIPWNWRLSLPNPTGVFLVSLWVVLAALRLGRLVRQCCFLHSLKRLGSPASEGLRTLFQTLSEEMGIKRETRLILSTESAAPMAVGFTRPAVLLPAKMFEGVADAQSQNVLRHELAHVSRRDDWTNLIQQTIKALLFFHPAIWWLTRRLTVEREIACDDHVLAATRTPRAYALFLTEFAGRMQGRDMAAAPAAWSNKNQLNERITMILDLKRDSSPRLARKRAGIMTAVAALITVLGLHTGPRLALAAEGQANAELSKPAIALETQNHVEISAVADTQTESTAELTIGADSAASIGSAAAGISDKTVASADLAPLEDQDAPNVPPKPNPWPEPVPAAPPAPGAPAVPSKPTLRAELPAALPRVASVPSPARSVSRIEPKRVNDVTIERRLERLERLVESLVAREKGPKQRAETPAEALSDSLKRATGFGVSADQYAKMAEDYARLAEQAQRAGVSGAHSPARTWDQDGKDAERAARVVERSVRESQRAVEEVVRAAQLEVDAVQARLAQSPSEVQLKILEAQSRALEKQLDAVTKQLGQIREEQEKIKARAEREEPRKPRELRADPGKPDVSSDTDDRPPRKSAR